MYPVSDAFLRAVKSNTRKYFWTGMIVTKGGMTYEFGTKEIVKGSGYITRQCCGSTEIELGTVYAAEMGILQFGLAETREMLCRNILADLSVIRYVPFDSDTIGNPALDPGDVLTFAGDEHDHGGSEQYSGAESHGDLSESQRGV